MTIGPEPITRTWLRSVRRGTSASLSWRERAQMYSYYGVSLCKWGRSRSLRACHQVDEAIEEELAIVRAGGALRVVLHRECAPVNEFDALHPTVVGAGVADDRGAEWRVEGLARLPLQ